MNKPMMPSRVQSYLEHQWGRPLTDYEYDTLWAVAAYKRLDGAGNKNTGKAMLLAVLRLQPQKKQAETLSTVV